MKRFLKKITAVISVATMLGTAIPQSVLASNNYATREYVVSQFIQSVGRNSFVESDYMLSTFSDSDQISDEYVDDVEKAVTAGIMRGYEDKTIRPKENVTRLEALVMMSRCIPEDETESGQAIEFTDVPDWAKEEIDKLSKNNIVYGYGDGQLGANDYITVEQVKQLTDRSDEFFNDTTAGESFYGYVNDKVFRNAELDTEPYVDVIHGSVNFPDNSWSYFSDAAQNIDDKTTELLTKLMNGEIEYENGTVEQRIHDMLECIQDSSNYHEEDAEIFNSYCKEIMNVTDIPSLLETTQKIYNETGVNVLFDVNSQSEPVAHAVYPSVKFKSTGMGSLMAFYSKNNTKENRDEYANLIKDYLGFLQADVSDADVDKAITIQMDTGKQTSYLYTYAMLLGLRAMYDPGYTDEMLKADIDAMGDEHPDMIDENDQLVDTTAWIKSYPAEQADNMFDNVGLVEQLESYGFDTPEQIILPEDRFVDCTKHILSEDNINALKINAVLDLGLELNCATSESEEEVFDNLSDFALKMFMLTDLSSIPGFDTEQSDFDDNSDILNMTNLATLNKLLPIDTGLLYCKYYYDDEDSDEVIKMFCDIAEEYIKEFEECEWMLPATKEAAIKKIENMIGVVGYPDNYNYPTIVPMSEGGTYFLNYINIMKDDKATIIHECNEKEFVRTEMFMTPSTVNACYIPTLNSMNIPAGIITWPMYDKNASYAANLGSIGSVIAHEIGHAFDANGAQYDENGCMNNWWSEEDQKLFKEKQEEFIEYYKNFEVVDGVVQDSSNTITENMADMAGIECVMSILSDDKEGQKEALLSFARMWAELGTETSLTNKDTLDDVHSSNQVRVNACVASQDCFYELFDIAEDDPMYVAPEDRLKLWIN